MCRKNKTIDYRLSNNKDLGDEEDMYRVTESR